MRLKIRELREKRGWTQAVLAKAAGLTRLTIINLENGKQQDTTISTLAKIANALEVSIDDLI